MLPFDNLTGDPKNDYLADGITDDLTTELANRTNVFVIARHSAATYKGKPINVKQVGDELGVRYVLEGSVRRLGDVLRINAQLVSTENSAHLWADRFDEPLRDLAEGQGEIVTRLGNALGWELVRAAAARSLRERPVNPDAFDLYLRAKSLLILPFSVERSAEGASLLERAIQLDPSLALAKVNLANVLINTGNANARARAAVLVSEAAALNPNASFVLSTSVFMLRSQGHFSEAFATAQRMMDLYPNDPESYNQLGTMMLAVGRLEEFIPLEERSVRCDPLSPYLFERYQRIGYAQMLLGHEEEAVPWFERSLASNPDVPPEGRADTYRQLAVAYTLNGRSDQARKALTEAVRLAPFETARSDVHWWGSEAAIAETRRYQEGLRNAGLRDHADETADFGVAPDTQVHSRLQGYTPTNVPGAITIRTSDLGPFLSRSKPIVIDTLLNFLDRSLPGAVGLLASGTGGDFSDSTQDRLRRKAAELTRGNMSMPIVVVGWSSERFDGYNLALRLVKLGYSTVYWYRGGREAWEVAGLPETELTLQDW